MIFESFLEGKRALEFAYSENLYNFKRSYQSFFTNLGHTKRDPCIIRDGDSYIVYICNPDPGGSAVSVTVTKDFCDLIWPCRRDICGGRRTVYHKLWAGG